MRRWSAIVRATALEICSEPLSLLLALSAMALAVVAPSMHYHQFGESTRMARDAGLSSLLVFGAMQAVFCTVRSFRREIESGTMQMALAHSVSRRMFFLAKLSGAALAYLVFAVAVVCVSVTAVNGARIGGDIAKATGDIATMYGPSLAVAVAAIVVPPVAAAVLNRFARFRFTPTAVALAAALAVLGVVFRFDAGTALRFLPAAAMLTLPAAVFMSASAAFAVKWRDNAATSLAGLLALVSVPALGNYYLSDALAKGGSLPWPHVALAAALTAPLVAAFAVLGVGFLNGRDVGGE